MTLRGLSLCLRATLVTTLSRAEVAQPIVMPSGGQTHVGPRNHVLDGVHISATWLIRWIELSDDSTSCLIRCRDIGLLSTYTRADLFAERVSL